MKEQAVNYYVNQGYSCAEREFKKCNKVNCCRVLSKGFEGAERKAHCSKFVSDACEILEGLVKVKV